MSEEQEILFEVRGEIGHVTLNRPKALNALTHEMCLAFDARLREWEQDPAIRAVIVEGAGDRAFCAGGDIVKLYNEGRARSDYPLNFYRDEYYLNTRIKHFPKPYIALIDGIVMGGGVGVSVHGSHRIATERTLFAMPETGIGLFPDVGGSYFLPRLEGQLGMYLGLTGARLKAGDSVYAGIAQVFVEADRLPALTDSLAEHHFGADAAADVDAIIGRFAHPAPNAPLAIERKLIDRHFSKNSVEEIIESLESAGDDFSFLTANTLKAKSPTSLKITFQQLRRGATLDFNDCMRMEFRMVTRVMQAHDFYEGTRATVIDKDQSPVWNPASLEAISDADVEAFFAPLERELY